MKVLSDNPQILKKMFLLYQVTTPCGGIFFSFPVIRVIAKNGGIFFWPDFICSHWWDTCSKTCNQTCQLEELRAVPVTCDLISNIVSILSTSNSTNDNLFLSQRKEVPWINKIKLNKIVMKVMHKNEKFDARGIYLISGADRGKGCESHDIREVYSGFVKPFRLNFLVSKTNTHPLTTVSFNFFRNSLYKSWSHWINSFINWFSVIPWMKRVEKQHWFESWIIMTKLHL